MNHLYTVFLTVAWLILGPMLGFFGGMALISLTSNPTYSYIWLVLCSAGGVTGAIYWVYLRITLYRSLQRLEYIEKIRKCAKDGGTKRTALD
jgi:hypothetical protein